MLSEKQIKKLKEHLNNAQNPVFFFDNDADGLCAFLLLQRYIGRGKGVPVRSFPEMDASYFRKVNELKADYIFILDKPVISSGFWEKAEQRNIPVVWIDHHEFQGDSLNKIPGFVEVFNPLYDEKGNKKQKEGEPVTVVCYYATKRKEDLWIAVAGAVSDKFMPDYYSEFKKKYPDLSYSGKKENVSAFDVLYHSEIGKIARVMSAGLKDKTSNIIAMLRFLTSAKTPYDVLEETSRNYLMRKRFNQVNEKYQKILKKAVSSFSKNDKILFFEYRGDLSLSAELSNELSYLFPDKYVIVVYIKGGVKANISGRGKNVREMVLHAIRNLKDARGGGHEDAVGAQIRAEDISVFKKNLYDFLRNKQENKK